jgi:caffeoyl-CoA O-methyltransferase
MAKPKSFTLDEEMHRYLVGHGAPPDEIASDLIAETHKVAGDFAMMQIAPEQGALMQLLTNILRPKFCVEIGTFTGYSALCVARGLPPDGKLLCCDVSEEWTSVARSFWERAGVSERIDLEIAPALDTLAALPPEQSVDLAFVDADKESYIQYYEALLPRLTETGLLLIDNVLWGGSVLDDENNESSTVAIRAFNDHVAADPRSEVVMLPVADGLSLIRRLP